MKKTDLDETFYLDESERQRLLGTKEEDIKKKKPKKPEVKKKRGKSATDVETEDEFDNLNVLEKR